MSVDTSRHDVFSTDAQFLSDSVRPTGQHRHDNHGIIDPVHVLAVILLRLGISTIPLRNRPNDFFRSFVARCPPAVPGRRHTVSPVTVTRDRRRCCFRPMHFIAALLLLQSSRQSTVIHGCIGHARGGIEEVQHLFVMVFLLVVFNARNVCCTLKP